MEKLRENNQVSITGEVVSEFIFSHEVFGESFYVMRIAAGRLSGKADVIPLIISERLINVAENYCGCIVEAIGQFRSYNKNEGRRNRLVLSVFVREISFVEISINYTKNNQISLKGCLCKEPIYRRTPLGREITDFLLAVNRPYGKSDYIPCIAWGRNARYVSVLSVGTQLCVWGRVQSREYVKQISETKHENRVAYEVSVSGLELGN